jgi:uncharacterized protein (TIGR03066 family)
LTLVRPVTLVRAAMSAVPTLLALAFLLPPPAADDPTPKTPTLTGTWVLVKGSADLPKDVSFVVAFSRDGEMVLRFDTGDPKQDTVHKGKYKLAAGKLAYTITTGSGERSETLTVKKLTATELVVVDPDGKREEFRRDDPKKKK